MLCAIMNDSVRTGFCFGLTSGIITTLGLMVGLHSGTNSPYIIIGGIITIAVADAFSDALGIHISEEGEAKHTTKEIWESTIATFLSKFIIAITFIIPVLVFELVTAIILGIVWGFLVLALLSYHIAIQQKAAPWKVIAEHLMILSLVIVTTHYVGHFVGSIFG
jgi:VIT1/CCC1 family predicted Fe2+/Mn2+ transporter